MIYAKYPTVCEAGGDDIVKGDPIVKDGASYSHVRCAEIDDEPDERGRFRRPRKGYRGQRVQ